MRLDFPLPGPIRVRNVSNYKGNPRTVVVLGDEVILVKEGHSEYPDVLTDVFTTLFGIMFVDWLKANRSSFFEAPDGDDYTGWQTHDDRGVSSSQFETIRYELDEPGNPW